MANWTNLKSSINEVIKTNGNQEITGQVLQNVLNTIVSTLGENATFVGVATPTTNPGTPDGNVFYIAKNPGVYPNFSSIEVYFSEIGILYWNTSSWKKHSISLSKLIEEVNISNIYPTDGTDGSNKYTLETAIAKVGEELRHAGLKVTFLNAEGKTETWEYQGGTFTSAERWRKRDAVEVVNELGNNEKAVVSQKTVTKYIYDNNRYACISVKYPIFNTTEMTFTLPSGTRVNNYKLGDITLGTDVMFDVSDKITTWSVWYLILDSNLNKRYVTNINKVLLSDNEAIIALVRFHGGNRPDVLCMFAQGLIKDGVTILNTWSQANQISYCTITGLEDGIVVDNNNGGSLTIKSGCTLNGFNGFKNLQISNTQDIVITNSDGIEWKAFYVIIKSDFSYRLVRNIDQVILSENEILLCLIRFSIGIIDSNLFSYILDGTRVYNYVKEINNNTEEVYAHINKYPLFNTTEMTFTLQAGTRITSQNFDYDLTPSQIVFSYKEATELLSTTWNIHYLILDSNLNKRYSQSDKPIKLKDNEAIIALVRFQAGEGPSIYNIRSSGVIIDGETVLSQWKKPNTIADKCLKNWGKSIGVFGGSLSVYEESLAAKNIWKENLDVTVTDYGVGGAGFSSLQGTSIQTQVDNADVKDIYILWASTNDYTNNRECGTWKDYTALDNYDESKLVTQCGGINYCIKKLLEKNPKAEIYFFTSLRFFSSEGGYNPFSEVINSIGKTFSEYVAEQKKCCEHYNIPVLDQFNLQGINEFNYTNYYISDKLHMNEEGYKKIGYVQAEFLKNGLN